MYVRTRVFREFAPKSSVQPGPSVFAVLHVRYSHVSFSPSPFSLSPLASEFVAVLSSCLRQVDCSACLPLALPPLSLPR